MGESSITSSKKRIDTIDVLRGFALAGILYAHFVIWYTGAAIPTEVYLEYDSTFDGVAMGVFGALVFGKFFSVFSFLFGLSFYLQFKKNQAETGFFKTYLWRLFLLFLIGLAHHIMWVGDILAIYAVLGIVLITFKKLPNKLLLVISLLLIINLPTQLYNFFSINHFDATVDFPMQAQARNYYALVQKEDFLTVLKANWNSWPAKIQYQLESGRLLMTFGYFLLGLYAGRTKLFSSIKTNFPKFKKWNKSTETAVIILLLLGLVMYLNNLVSIPEIKVVPELRWTASFLFDIYNACLSIFYITGITLLFNKKVFHKTLKPLAPMGRMALTNYLLQTFFGLLFFYQFGLGFFDQTSPAVNALLAVLILFFQIKFNQYWLTKYNQGPVEWLWKSLTYLKFPSLRKKKVGSQNNQNNQQPKYQE